METTNKIPAIFKKTVYPTVATDQRFHSTSSQLKRCPSSSEELSLEITELSYEKMQDEC